jgi:hypothetical protein
LVQQVARIPPRKFGLGFRLNVARLIGIDVEYVGITIIGHTGALSRSDNEFSWGTQVLDDGCREVQVGLFLDVSPATDATIDQRRIEKSHSIKPNG